MNRQLAVRGTLGRAVLSGVMALALVVSTAVAAQYQYRTSYVYSEGFPDWQARENACLADWTGMIVEQGVQYAFLSATVVNYLSGDIWEVSCAYSTEF